MIKILIVFLSLCNVAMVHAADTVLKLYRPQVSKHMAINITGECLGPSELIKRKDAWRCKTQGKQYDPCFLGRIEDGYEALCVASPWDSHGVLLTIGNQLDNSSHEAVNMAENLPWALILTNGEKCRAVSGDSAKDDLPVRYKCSGDIALVGHVQRCKSSWKILRHDKSGISLVNIEKAWF